MGNISYRLGAARNPEEVQEALRADKAGSEAFGRFREHLALHGVDLQGKPAVMGPWLEMDSATERFTGPHAAQANALVRRQYRHPYVIPEKV